MAQGNVFKSSAAAKMAKALRKKKAAANKHGRGGMTTKRGEKIMQCRLSFLATTTMSTTTKDNFDSQHFQPFWLPHQPPKIPGKFVRPPKKLDLLKKAAEEKAREERKRERRRRRREREKAERRFSCSKRPVKNLKPSLLFQPSLPPTHTHTQKLQNRRSPTSSTRGTSPRLPPRRRAPAGGSRS